MIYLDHAASTPCDPRVVEAMLPYFTEHAANPSSVAHEPGRTAREAVETARAQVAELLGAHPEEIVFTAGASESDNLAVKGAARAAGSGHVITTSFEHVAVLKPCRRLEQEGFDVTYVEPGTGGIVTAEHVAAALRDDTVLVSIIWTNNEIGTLCEVPEIARVCHERGVLMHTDATQYVGHGSVDVSTVPIDMLSLSGHKINGPKGVGALYVRGGASKIALQPIVEGGAHEWNLRAGTYNTPGIVGLGVASALCRAEMADDARRLHELRCRLEDGLAGRVGDVVVNGDRERRAPHIANLSFPVAAGARVIDAIDDVACSTGCAVSSGSVAASHVLRAIGVSDELAITSLRLSLGRTTVADEIDAAIEHVAAAVRQVAPQS
ncbi:MAG: cysteine desulfurase [Planctomycetes bacterium]|nr:cysteine desulfurase [Planctomycetota bacterium]